LADLYCEFCLNKLTIWLTGNFGRLKAIAAKYRASSFGLKRYHCAFTAGSAGSRKRFALSPEPGLNALVIALADLTGFAGFAAGGAAFGGIGITFGRESLLFFYAENEFTTAIKTFDSLLLQTH
jgi:hypothetical protein